jgi:hypothetical protein
MLSLIYKHWSDDDKTLWKNAFPDSDLKRARIRQNVLARRVANRHPKSTPTRIAPETVRNQRQAVERYLGFLQRRHPDMLTKPWVERVERALLAEFVKDFEPTKKRQSIADTLNRLAKTLESMAPQVDLSDIYEIALAIPDRTRKSSRRPPLVHAGDLLNAALDQMDELQPIIRALEKAPTSCAEARAPRVLYRNILIIAILVADPLRKKNGCGLTLHETFKILANAGFEIVIPKHLMKCKNRGHRRKLLKKLDSYVRFYLDHVRRRFGGAAQQNALWLTWQGEPLSMISFHVVVTNTTKMLVGERLTAQDFRKLIADLVARLGLPIAIAKRALDHAPSSPITEDKYTSVKRAAGVRLLGQCTAAEFVAAGLAT